jgi:hypothetical protein
MPITVISVAKSYSHRGSHRHRQGTKKHHYLYYLDHEDGKFKSKRISPLEALYYRTQKRHRYRFACSQCGGISIALVKSLKEDVECPYCHTMVSLEVLTDEYLEDPSDDEV